MLFSSHLIIKAREIAEREHAGQLRKAPLGEQGEPFINHPLTVAGILADADCDETLIAAALLHDVLEDTEMDAVSLLEEITHQRVVELVLGVTERESGQGWEARNQAYYQRMLTAEAEVLTLSTADKAHNLEAMLYWLDRGYGVEQLLSRGYSTQLAKYLRLEAVYQGRVVQPVYDRFRAALDTFKAMPP
ncbi:HD domain-containing protein [Desulfogranum mediterraneum]|uniref:HD domain-containing protein n=1 Tax=Desulfogranum mediterraneum TaxID=160661 RepID=UPI00041BF17C|nr:HD domain-containing protein [Desulfogranum mediterraneum]